MAWSYTSFMGSIIQLWMPDHLPNAFLRPTHTEDIGRLLNAINKTWNG